MSKKQEKKTKKFDIWVERKHTFTATIEADDMQAALNIASDMSEDELLDTPGDNIDSEFTITGVLKA